MNIKLLSRDAMAIWNCYLSGALSDGEWENSWYSDLYYDAKVSLAKAPEDFGIENGFDLSTEDCMKLLAFRPSDVLSSRSDPKKMKGDFGYWTRDDLLAILILKSFGLSDELVKNGMFDARSWNRKPHKKDESDAKLKKQILDAYSADPAKWILKVENAMHEIDVAFRTTYYPQIDDDKEFGPRYVCWFCQMMDGYAPSFETGKYKKKLEME